MRLTRNALLVVPPYFTGGAPPLGPAALLAYLGANGCDEFDFLDLRLWVPNAYAPTYRATGVFGETYVIDVPDLPLVLSVLQNAKKGDQPLPSLDDWFSRYCLERGISASLLADYLAGMNRFLDAALSQLPLLEFVGFSVWSSNYLTTLMAAAHLKRRHDPPFIVFGGPQTTESEASAKLALRSGLADAVALGEGEETLLRLYEAFRSSGLPSQAVPGTMRYDAQTGCFESAERPLLRLRSLPLPAFDKLPLPAYGRGGGSHRTVTYELSRGCTDKCVFCSEWVFWRRIRTDDVERVVENVAQLQQGYGAEAVWFMDSLLNATANRLRQFAEELLRRRVVVRWGGYLRANVDHETAVLLKRAGCEFVFVGVESLSDETLQLMNKRRTEADNLGALEALLGAGVDRVVAGFIPGFPGDTRERFTRTALLLGEIHRRFPGRFRVNVEPFVISPKQPMYAHLQDHGLVGKPWDEEYLRIAEQHRDITGSVLCSVDGPNQGLDRMGESRIAQTVTATSAIGPDPFMYFEGEALSTAELSLGETVRGWYMGRMKSDHGLVYGLILSTEERSELERIEAGETVGSGYGFGRRPASSLFERQAVDDLLRRVERRHLIPPRRARPDLRRASFRHRPPRATDELQLSPFVVARMVADRGDNVVLLLDLATGRWQTVDGTWEHTLRRLSDGTVPAGDLVVPGLGAAVATAELARLLESGAVWTTRAVPEEPSRDHNVAMRPRRMIPVRVEAEPTRIASD